LVRKQVIACKNGMDVAEFLCKSPYIKVQAIIVMQVEEHALTAMHQGTEHLDSNSEKSICDKDSALMG
jgi:hypothetical protein